MDILKGGRIKSDWHEEVRELSEKSDLEVECPRCYKKTGKVYLKSINEKKYFDGGYCFNCNKAFNRHRNTGKKPEDAPIFLTWNHYKDIERSKLLEKQDTLL